jgi:hypothetical protein
MVFPDHSSFFRFERDPHDLIHQRSISKSQNVTKPLIVAREPAVQISFLLFVTGNAKAHLELNPLEAINRLHLTVTLFAHDLFLDVSFVVEKDMLREIIHFDPGRRRLAIKIPVLLLNFRMADNDVLVTVKAFLNRRDAGEMRTAHIGMTEFALDLFHSCMNPVAERDRLLRAQGF